MSYMETAIRLYAVKLSYDEAQRVLECAGHEGFRHERANEFRETKAEFTAIDPFEMQMMYEDLQEGLSTSYTYKSFSNLLEFFDYFNFPSQQVRAEHHQTIPTSYDERRGIQYYRRRYYADLFCEDADSRGDSLRILPGRTTYYGIYVASDGYAYRDDLRAFDADLRIAHNFQMYCAPILTSLHLERSPEWAITYQIW